MKILSKHDRNRGGRNGRQEAIVESLRRQIAAGTLAAGARLPTRVALQHQFATTPATVQKAIDQLAADGFTRAAGRHGTFVAAHPPCLAHYAIVFPGKLSATHRDVNLWRAMANEVNGSRFGRDRQFTLYLDLNGHTDEPDYHRLQTAVRARRLAGIIYASHPFLLFGSPLWAELQAAALPQVAVMSPDAGFPMPTVHPDGKGYLEQALRLFQSRHCRRAALLGTLTDQAPNSHLPYEDVWHTAAARHGLATRPCWVQAMHPLIANRARQLTHLLFTGTAAERPDALLILDDALVEHATRGLLDAGVRVPQELTVVAHANFPWPPTAATPVTYLGYDIGRLLDTCLDVLDAQRHGRSVPPHLGIPPCMDPAAAAGEPITASA